MYLTDIEAVMGQLSGIQVIEFKIQVLYIQILRY